MKNFEVYESNAGTLILVAYGNNGKPEYIHGGYEYTPGRLSQDLVALGEGTNSAKEWENNIVDEINIEDLKDMTIVVDNDGICPNKMGIAAKKEFGIK